MCRHSSTSIKIARLTFCFKKSFQNVEIFFLSQMFEIQHNGKKQQNFFEKNL